MPRVAHSLCAVFAIAIASTVFIFAIMFTPAVCTRVRVGVCVMQESVTTYCLCENIQEVCIAFFLVLGMNKLCKRTTI